MTAQEGTTATALIKEHPTKKERLARKEQLPCGKYDERQPNKTIIAHGVKYCAVQCTEQLDFGETAGYTTNNQRTNG